MLVCSLLKLNVLSWNSDIIRLKQKSKILPSSQQILVKTNNMVIYLLTSRGNFLGIYKNVPELCAFQV